MIKRLRPLYTDEELKAVYDHQYDHKMWEDHRERIKLTIEFAAKVPLDGETDSVADLSAGDAAIINALPYETKIVGDFYPSYEYVGKIEDTIKQIPRVDLFILSETLEHVDAPIDVLKAIREKTKYILVSTPENNWEDGNPEHYWAWDKQGVGGLLGKAGFTPIEFESHTLHYTHQFWICE